MKERVEVVKPKLHLRKDDNVLIISGKDKGKKGKIIEVRPRKSKVIVEGVNIVKKHSRPTPRNPQSGGIHEMEAPIHSSNTMLICPSCQKPTRVLVQTTGDRNRGRTCKKCGKELDK